MSTLPFFSFGVTTSSIPITLKSSSLVGVREARVHGCEVVERGALLGREGLGLARDYVPSHGHSSVPTNGDTTHSVHLLRVFGVLHEPLRHG